MVRASAVPGRGKWGKSLPKNNYFSTKDPVKMNYMINVKKIILIASPSARAGSALGWVSCGLRPHEWIGDKTQSVPNQWEFNLFLNPDLILVLRGRFSFSSCNLQYMSLDNTSTRLISLRVLNKLTAKSTRALLMVGYCSLCKLLQVGERPNNWPQLTNTCVKVFRII